ncbi:MAG: hypothetical protein CMH31_02555 [Micavibrio sp.]|nr:hypothetical protein [Micavibrio sp.]|tara:strand:- start:700 stop:1266 length:567 start_codon:yes stop_codon:yes gene_type:complete
MLKSSWLIPIIIFVVSYFILSILFFCLKLDVENIRAFAMWSTMTAGITGLYVAIQKFGIDFQSHSTKTLSCVFQQKGIFVDDYRHTFDLFNRSEVDIYIKNFECKVGELKKYKKVTKDYPYVWRGSSFCDERSCETIKDTNSIQPDNSMRVAVFIPHDQSADFKLKIIYTENDYYGDEKFIETIVRQN